MYAPIHSHIRTHTIHIALMGATYEDTVKDSAFECANQPIHYSHFHSHLHSYLRLAHAHIYSYRHPHIKETIQNSTLDCAA